jgi:hypothetical protein
MNKLDQKSFLTFAAQRAPEEKPVLPLPWKALLTPYHWPDPASIPRRAFLLGKHYTRGFVSVTIAPGGRLKTTLGMTEAIGMTAKRDLLRGAILDNPLRVAVLNAEEPQEELDRRVAAICQHLNIEARDCDDRLIVRSLRERSPRFATLDARGGCTLNKNELEAFKAELEALAVDVVILDPWISFHAVNENLSMHMDPLIKEALGGIAEQLNLALEIAHHPRKSGPGQADMTTVEDSRGSGALVFAARSARVLNFMTSDEAKKLAVPDDDRRLYVRIDNGKANMAPLGKATWLKIMPIWLPNGEEVAAIEGWKPPDPFEGITTADMEWCKTVANQRNHKWDSRAEGWIGNALAERLTLDPSNAKSRAKLKEILKLWRKNKVFDVETRTDEHRNKRKYVVPAGSAEENDDVE